MNGSRASEHSLLISHPRPWSISSLATEEMPGGRRFHRAGLRLIEEKCKTEDDRECRDVQPYRASLCVLREQSSWIPNVYGSLISPTLPSKRKPALQFRSEISRFSSDLNRLGDLTSQPAIQVI